MNISSEFDGGNIVILNSDNPANIELAIRKDTQADFLQWFYFRLQGEVGEQHVMSLMNAHECSYVKGWENYRVAASYDREHWFRVDTQYEDGVLKFAHTLEQNAVYFAYFAPYSYERHLDLIQQATQSPWVSLLCPGKSVQGRPMDVLKIGMGEADENVIWIIARQHPGETMAEWFMEGLLSRLLDEEDPTAQHLLQHATFYLVPNMNPDGAIAGNLRTNASGANLNREWADPSVERSPEVFAIKQMMIETGCHLFLDIHGDEAIPYNFVAGCEGIPSYNEKMASLENKFKDAFLAVSKDFQVEHGYSKDEPGQANLSLACTAIGELFQCLAFTIEMPFKDNDNLPNKEVGWSSNRSFTLGRDCLFPIAQVINQLKG